MVEREPHVSQRGVDEIRPGQGERRGQLPPPFRGQRGEQAPSIGEVMGRRGVRHPRGAGQLTQRDPVGAAFGHQHGGLAQDDGLQVAVVIGVPVHRAIIAANLDSA